MLPLKLTALEQRSQVLTNSEREKEINYEKN